MKIENTKMKKKSWNVVNKNKKTEIFFSSSNIQFSHVKWSLIIVWGQCKEEIWPGKGMHPIGSKHHYITPPSPVFNSQTVSWPSYAHVTIKQSSGLPPLWSSNTAPQYIDSACTLQSNHWQHWNSIVSGKGASEKGWVSLCAHVKQSECNILSYSIQYVSRVREELRSTDGLVERQHQSPRRREGGPVTEHWPSRDRSVCVESCGFGKNTGYGWCLALRHSILEKLQKQVGRTGPDVSPSHPSHD